VLCRVDGIITGDKFTNATGNNQSTIYNNADDKPVCSAERH